MEALGSQNILSLSIVFNTVSLCWVGFLPFVIPNLSSALLCCVLCPGRLVCLDYIKRLPCPLASSLANRGHERRSEKGRRVRLSIVSAPVDEVIPPQKVMALSR